ncbi:MAG: cob(I)yrinic acid a,c-diamide adenosyltransferase [bacterium]
MLYTGKGDKGTTKTFGCNQSISKSSAVTEALGSLDEINSFLGIIKTKVENVKYKKIVHEAQESLFIVQAEVAGFPKPLSKGKVGELEKIIADAEKELPKIKTFFISGGTEVAAFFDFARTIARRAERRVVAVAEEGKVAVSDSTLAYLNRLSSLLYALARLSNHEAGVKEDAPDYK